MSARSSIRNVLSGLRALTQSVETLARSLEDDDSIGSSADLSSSMQDSLDDDATKNSLLMAFSFGPNVFCAVSAEHVRCVENFLSRNNCAVNGKNFVKVFRAFRLLAKPGLAKVTSAKLSVELDRYDLQSIMLRIPKDCVKNFPSVPRGITTSKIEVAIPTTTKQLWSGKAPSNKNVELKWSSPNAGWTNQDVTFEMVEQFLQWEELHDVLTRTAPHSRERIEEIFKSEPWASAVLKNNWPEELLTISTRASTLASVRGSPGRASLASRRAASPADDIVTVDAVPASDDDDHLRFSPLPNIDEVINIMDNQDENESSGSSLPPAISPPPPATSRSSAHELILAKAGPDSSHASTGPRVLHLTDASSAKEPSTGKKRRQRVKATPLKRAKLLKRLKMAKRK